MNKIQVAKENIDVDLNALNSLKINKKSNSLSLSFVV